MTGILTIVVTAALSCTPEPEISGPFLEESGPVPANGVVHVGIYAANLWALEGLVASPPQVELREVNVGSVGAAVRQGVVPGGLVFEVKPVEPLDLETVYELCVTPAEDGPFPTSGTAGDCPGSGPDGTPSGVAGFFLVTSPVAEVAPTAPVDLRVDYVAIHDPDAPCDPVFRAFAWLNWTPSGPNFGARYAVYREVDDGLVEVYRYTSWPWPEATFDFDGCGLGYDAAATLEAGVPHVLRVTAIGPTGLESEPSEPITVALVCSEPGVIEAQGDPPAPPPAPEPEAAEPESDVSTAEPEPAMPGGPDVEGGSAAEPEPAMPDGPDVEDSETADDTHSAGGGSGSGGGCAGAGTSGGSWPALLVLAAWRRRRSRARPTGTSSLFHGEPGSSGRPGLASVDPSPFESRPCSCPRVGTSS